MSILHEYYSSLVELNSSLNLNTNTNSDLNYYIPGIIHISGKNGSGKTTFISKLIKKHSPLNNLNEFILELTPGKLADYLLKYFNNIPFDKITNLVKKDILKLMQEIAFETGKIKGNSISFEKETEINLPQETLEILVDLENKMKMNRDKLISDLKKNLKLKIKPEIKIIPGVYFTQEYLLGSNSVLDELYSNSNCISQVSFLETQLKLNLLEKDHFTDHSNILNSKKFNLLQNKIQEKYSKISLENISEIKKLILEKEKQLKKLKTYKSELTTRKYQKEILKTNYLESTKFINGHLKSLDLNGPFIISEKGASYKKVKFNDLSGSEKVILEIYFRIYLNEKLNFEFICIDELLDKISDLKHIKTILILLLEKFKFVFLVSHRKDIIDSIEFSQVIQI